MFYKTKIQSINGGSIIDEQGRRLAFIGYLPVKVGDTVFTDGKYIFGNVPPKGSPVVFDEPSGIPVLGDSDSSNNELRGYLTTTQGRFKNYKIAQDDWITNSDKKFAHGKEKFNDERVIDAEIDKYGNEFIVTDGFYRESNPCHLYYPVSIFHHCREVYEWKMWENLIAMYGSLYSRYFLECNVTRGYPLILGSDDFKNETASVKIYKNNTCEVEFNLDVYAKDIAEKALQCAQTIESQSYNEEEEMPYASWQEIRENEVALRPNGPPVDDYYGHYIPNEALTRREHFIAYTSVHVLTSNIDNETEDSKTFSGTLFASAYGYCFPYIKSRVWYYMHNPRTGHNISRNPIREWKSVPFGASCIYVIEKGTLKDIISVRHFGGIKTTLITYPHGTTIDTAFSVSQTYVHDNCIVHDWYDIATTTQVEMLPNFIEDTDDEKFIPVGEGFYQMDKFCRLSFYNSKRAKIAENVPIGDDIIHIELESAYYEAEQERYYNLYSVDYSIRNVFSDKPSFIRAKMFYTDGTWKNIKIDLNSQIIYTGTLISDNPIVGEFANLSAPLTDFQAKGDFILSEFNLDNDDSKMPPMDAYYMKTKDGKWGELKFTPLFYEFKNGTYLYGVKGGKLYYKNKDEDTLIGDGLKNFRLRELKRISKARK